MPVGYHVESRAASGLLWSGALTLSASYLAGIGFGLSTGMEDGMGWVFVPIVGPWAAIGARRFTCGAETVTEAEKCLHDAYSEATTIAVLAVDGMLQATGLVVTAAALGSGREELVRDDVRSSLRLSAGARREGGFNVGLGGQF